MFGDAGRMAWFLRVIELSDGRWACRHGKIEFDIHSEMQPAIDHILAVAIRLEPAQLFLHRLDGAIQQISDIEPPPPP